MSCKFVKRLMAIPFYYFLFPAETYMICIKVFYYSETVGSDKRYRISL